jgi:hypothetical protein
MEEVINPIELFISIDPRVEIDHMIYVFSN